MSADHAHSSEVQMELARVQAVKSAHEAELLSKANVVGVGIGLRLRAGARTDQVALVVLVTEKLPPSQLTLDDIIPTEIEGVPIDVQQVGHVRAER